MVSLSLATSARDGAMLPVSTSSREVYQRNGDVGYVRVEGSTRNREREPLNYNASD